MVLSLRIGRLQLFGLLPTSATSLMIAERSGVLLLRCFFLLTLEFPLPFSLRQTLVKLLLLFSRLSGCLSSLL